MSAIGVPKIPDWQSTHPLIAPVDCFYLVSSYLTGPSAGKLLSGRWDYAWSLRL